MQAIETLKSASKSAIASFIAPMVEAVKNGEITAVNAYLMAKGYEEAAKAIKTLTQDSALSELSKLGGKSELFGAKIDEANRTDYDYTACNYFEYNELLQEIESLKEKAKEMEAFLKSIKAPIELANPKTGELETIYPPVKKHSTTIKVTLAK